MYKQRGDNPHHYLTSTMTQKVLIRCQPTLKDWLTENNIQWTYSKEYGQRELDVIVDDIPYTIEDGIYQDPDQQFIEHYGIDYDQVNCIEAM